MELISVRTEMGAGFVYTC